MRLRISETSPKLADFKVRRSDTSQFASVEGLSNMAGVSRQWLRRLIAKEVVDNALDEMDSAQAESGSVDGGIVTVRRVGDDTYVVTDEGRGIEQNPDKLCDLFSADRFMVSGKALHRPSRGVLGNGLRILASAIALSGGTIIVESHGTRTELRPRKVGARIGNTEVLSQVSARRKLGTEITYTLGAIIPYDEDDLEDAEAAIRLAEDSGPAYMRLPSPHWQDCNHLVEICDCIEPETMTVRQLVEGLDGCSGATAGRLAAPFGKERLCREMSEPQIAALLRSMQERARVVKPHSLGPIGPSAFGGAFNGYRVAEAWLEPILARQPRARIPVLIEAWASVTSRRGGDASLTIYCNRTSVVGGADAAREHKGISIYGAGLNETMKVDGGDCELIVAVTSPFIPTKSLGKAPDLSRLEPQIVDALRRAFNQSRNRRPPDPAQPKPPKGEPPPKPPKPEPYQASGPLATRLAKEAEQAGLAPADLLVLSPGHDPFNETEANRRNAEWFVEQVERLVPKDQRVHPRGMYYRCQSAGDVRLPDGTPFVGSSRNADFVEASAKYARHLGLIAFDRIIDERNAPAELYVFDEKHDIVTDDPFRRELMVSMESVLQESWPLDVPELERLLPMLAIAAPQIPRQRFRICLIGEKASLAEVLRPIAKEVRGELLLATGEVSEDAAFRICQRAAMDGRPLRILYFSDFDPAGWQMPISVARKLQAHICREFHDLNVQVIPVALTFKQVQQFKLPWSPIKSGERRARAWRKRWWGIDADGGDGEDEDIGGQVEIDALAALRPEVLEKIAWKAVYRYFDPTFERRFTEAMELSAEQQAWFLEQPAYKLAQVVIGKAYKAMTDALTGLNDTTSAAVDAMRHVVEEVPDLSDVVVKPEIGDDQPEEVIFDSSDDFVTATRKLQNLKALSAGNDDD